MKGSLALVEPYVDALCREIELVGTLLREPPPRQRAPGQLIAQQGRSRLVKRLLQRVGDGVVHLLLRGGALRGRPVPGN